MQYVITDSDRIIEDMHYTGARSALEIHPDGKPYHTFRTATVRVTGNHLTFRRCSFANTAGPGKTAAQAIALYLDGDNLRLEDCVLEGHQDTLFLAPLPPKEIQKDGFLGPGQFTPRTDRTVYFKNCRIEGGVDFVFGGATAFFDGCVFVSNEPGFVFAPSTPEHVKTGFVARNCRFERTVDVPDASCYLARPWREYGKVRLEDCFLDAHICPEGFHDWNKPRAHETALFEEYRSYGPGAEGAGRPDWVRFEP
jgi:pectinesterase